MIIFHTADWHLGRMLYGRSLLEDQRDIIKRCFLAEAEKRKPDLVIIAGDVYDRQIAPAEAIALLNETLEQLIAMGIKVVLISGNHDGAERIALMKHTLRQAGVFICTDLKDCETPIELVCGDVRVQLFPVPYLDPSAVRAHYNDDSLRGEAACHERVIAELLPQFKQGYHKILCAHCFVAGAEPSDSENGLFVGGSGQVPASVFSAFDYVALGHLHRGQKAGRNGRYAGSPLKYSIDESLHKKSFVQLKLTPDSIESEQVALIPKHDVCKRSGLFAELQEEGICEDYVEITLLDDAPVLHAAERLRAFFPNLLSVRTSWALTGKGMKDVRQMDRRSPSSGKVFRSFMEEVCGIEVNDAQLALFQELMLETEGADER